MRRSDSTPLSVLSWNCRPRPWNGTWRGGRPCKVMSGTGWKKEGCGASAVASTPGAYPAPSSSAARYFTARSAPVLPGLRPSSRSSERKRSGAEMVAGVIRLIAARSAALKRDWARGAVCGAAGVRAGAATRRARRAQRAGRGMAAHPTRPPLFAQAFSAGLGPGRHGGFGLVAPVAPGSDVQLTSWQARQLQGEQGVAGGHAAAAGGNHLVGPPRAEPLIEGAQLLGRAEPALLQVAAERRIHRSGDVTGALVDRLGLAPVTLRGPGVHHQRPPRCRLLAAGQKLRDARPVDDPRGV